MVSKIRVGALVGAIFFLSLFVSSAFADKCKEQIVDEVGVLSSDNFEQIRSLIGDLESLGALPRVQIISSFHDTESMDAYKEKYQKGCSLWRAPDGGMKNNLILFIVAPKKKATGFYYGGQWQRQLGNAVMNVSTDMNARFRDGDIAGGIVNGLKNTHNLLSVNIADAGKSVVINQSADYSGFSSFLKWLLAIVVCGGSIYLFLVWRQREAKVRDAQRDAQTLRAKCSQAMNGFTLPHALLLNKIKDLKGSHQRRVESLASGSKDLYDRAVGEFNALSRSPNNPETKGLSADEYSGMRERYQEVYGLFIEAVEALNRAETELHDAHLTKDDPPLKNYPFEKPKVSNESLSASFPSRKGMGRPQRHHTVPNGGSGQDKAPEPPPVKSREEKPPADNWSSRRQEEPELPVIVQYTNIVVDNGGGSVGSSNGRAEAPKIEESKGNGVSSVWGSSLHGGGASVSFGEPDIGHGSGSSWEKNPGTSY